MQCKVEFMGGVGVALKERTVCGMDGGGMPATT